MRREYRCPACRADLNPGGGRIVLLADRGQSLGLFLFSEVPGDYAVDLPSGIEVRPGETWRFRCPVCRADLTSAENDTLAALRLVPAGGAERAVVFSRVAGERCTFVVAAEGLEQSHGTDVDRYSGLMWVKFF